MKGDQELQVSTKLDAHWNRLRVPGPSHQRVSVLTRRVLKLRVPLEEESLGTWMLNKQKEFFKPIFFCRDLHP